MPRIRTTWYAAGAALLLSSGAVAWQCHTTHALRFELEPLRVQHRTLRRLQEENRRLAKEEAPPDELELLRAERLAVARLRRDIAILRTRVRTAMASTASPRIPTAPSSANTWRNVGRATPHATLETALWAAAGGDLPVLAASLELTPAARRKAEALLANLPGDVRARCASVEQLVALFTARDITFRAMQLVRANVEADTARLLVSFETAEGHTKRTDLTLRRHDDGWKLVAPESAVDRYDAYLRAAAVR